MSGGLFSVEEMLLNVVYWIAASETNITCEGHNYQNLYVLLVNTVDKQKRL